MSDPLAEIDRLLRSCMHCKRDKTDASTTPCRMCSPLPKYPPQAPDGQMFVCGACGRVSSHLYGDGKSSWDESCMSNAVLCHESSIVRSENGFVTKAEAVEGY